MYQPEITQRHAAAHRDEMLRKADAWRLARGTAHRWPASAPTRPGRVLRRAAHLVARWA
jgi:hypothetical protein